MSSSALSKDFVYNAVAAGLAFAVISRFAGPTFALTAPSEFISVDTLRHGVAVSIAVAAGEYAVNEVKKQGYLS